MHMHMQVRRLSLIALIVTSYILVLWIAHSPLAGGSEQVVTVLRNAYVHGNHSSSLRQTMTVCAHTAAAVHLNVDTVSLASAAQVG